MSSSAVSQDLLDPPSSILMRPSSVSVQPARNEMVGARGAEPRVAIVHYWLVTMRGGEKVLEELCRLYPNADIFTLVLDDKRLSPLLRERRITTSFLQKIPGITKHYQKFLPVMPFALEHFDLTAYDIVVSSEAGPAKGVIVRPDALHVCYCHSPMRYIWDQYHTYRTDLGWFGRTLMTIAAPLLRVWDVTTAARVDVFVANSSHVARRIRRVYGRTAQVVHPPVSVEDFAIAPERDDFYLCAGQLVSYKRVDLAVQAFNENGRRLVVIGEGPQFAELKRIAKPNIEFMGFQPFSVLKDHLARCRALIFPGEEDFGILPLEAMASGRPVIAYDAGGARETVSDPSVGIRFPHQDVASLNQAILSFEAREAEFDSETIRASTFGFRPEAFRDKMQEVVETALRERAPIASTA